MYVPLNYQKSNKVALLLENQLKLLACYITVSNHYVQTTEETKTRQTVCTDMECVKNLVS